MKCLWTYGCSHFSIRFSIFLPFLVSVRVYTSSEHYREREGGGRAHVTQNSPSLLIKENSGGGDGGGEASAALIAHFVLERRMRTIRRIHRPLFASVHGSTAANSSCTEDSQSQSTSPPLPSRSLFLWLFWTIHPQ